MDVPLYFGFVVASTKIPDKLKIARKILVELLYDNEVIDDLDLDARIFRPTLEVIKAIEKIELSDEQEKFELPIHLKYIGFGDISLKIEAVIGGRIVSHGESMIYELLRRLWLSDILGGEDTSEGGKKGRIRVEPTFIQEISEQLEKKIESGDISSMSEMIGERDIEDFKHWLSDVKTKNKFLDIMYSRVENLLPELLTDSLKRYPSDSVKLASARTKIKAKIELPVEDIKICLKYTDPMENEYPPVEIPIKIEDKRVEKEKTIIDIPIVIERLREEPFMNVAEMKIDEE